MVNNWKYYYRENVSIQFTKKYAILFMQHWGSTELLQEGAP